jgi:BioD-like phosphotransacetylase family protein
MLAGPSSAAHIFLAAPTVSSEKHQGIGLKLAEAWKAIVDDGAKGVVVSRFFLPVLCQRREADLPN